MLRSLKVGRAFGVDVFLHWSFWILPALFIYHMRSYTVGTATLALATVAVFAFFIIAHEFGHILMARVFGIRTRDVILTPLGGMARMERMTERPSEEILIAIAGPAVNVVAATVLGAVAVCCYQFNIFHLSETFMTPPYHRITNAWDMFAMVIGMNVVMAIFNLLPAFPMDGGRILRGILAAVADRVTATKIAVYLGAVVIGVVGLGLFWQGNILALPLAVFIAVIGQVELVMVKRKDAYLKQKAYERSVRDDLDNADDGIAPGLPPEPGFSGYSWNAGAGAWIEWRDGNPVRASRMRAG